MFPSNVNRRRFLGLSGLAAAGTLFARSVTRACPVIEPPKIANSINAFAADLHPRLAKDEKGSFFCSPLSISAALTMTSAGARGVTLEEMEKVLHLPQDPHPVYRDLLNDLNGGGNGWFRKCSYDLSVANAIWAQKGYPWHKEFIELTRKHYGAGTVETNFAKSEAARKQINDWVEKETNEKIKDLIPTNAIDALTRMVLVNAIYFKGDWKYQFDKKETKDAPFTRANGTKADVPLMHLSGEFNYGTLNLGGGIDEPKGLLASNNPNHPVGFQKVRPVMRAQVLELPYAGNDLSMLIYLPETRDGAHLLAQYLSAGDLSTPALTPQKVNVHLPRFKAESSFFLKPVLMNMGMMAAFTSADFTGMSPNGKDLYITHVLHKAFVDVNEEGSEAAAATAVSLGDRDIKEPMPPVEFRADRPFVFTIRHNETGAVLFLGRYSGPK